VAGGTVVRGCHASSRRVRFVSPEPRERRQAAATGLKVPVYAYCGGQTLHPSRNWGEIEGESPSGYPVVDGMRPDFAPWRGQFWGRDSFRQTYWGNAAQVRPGAALAAARHARSLARVAVCAAALAYVSACANRLPHVELETQQGEVFDDAAGAPDTLDTAEASAPSCKPRWTSDASIPEPCNGRDDDCDGLTDEDDQACHCGALHAPCAAGFDCVGGRCLGDAGRTIYVPPGTFWIGCNATLDPLCDGSVLYLGRVDAPLGSPPDDSRTDELPQVERTVRGFAIDRYPVTVLDYVSCIQAGLCPTTADGRICEFPYCAPLANIPLDKELLGGPMVGLAWSEAREYCENQGKRLCTESEWELAARGACALHCDGSQDPDCCRKAMPTFPWGETIPTLTDHPHSNVLDWTCGTDLYDSYFGCCTQGLAFWHGYTPVTSHPSGASVYGVEDLVGNVGQWVDGCLVSYATDENSSDACHRHRVLRGYDLGLADSLVPCTATGFCEQCDCQGPKISDTACGTSSLAVHRAGSRFGSIEGRASGISGARCCADVETGD
jgi:formylglycine-generating enzyme required for sulfatase activity